MQGMTDLKDSKEPQGSDVGFSCGNSEWLVAQKCNEQCNFPSSDGGRIMEIWDEKIWYLCQPAWYTFMVDSAMPAARTCWKSSWSVQSGNGWLRTCSSCVGTCVQMEVCCDRLCVQKGQSSVERQMVSAYICAACNVCGLQPVFIQSPEECIAKLLSMWLVGGSCACSRLIKVTNANEASSPPWFPNYPLRVTQ